MPLILKYSFFLLFVVGLCLTAGSEVNAQTAPDQGAWLIGSTGTTTVIAPVSVTGHASYAYFGLIKGINANQAVNTDKCLGGTQYTSGVTGGDFDPGSYIDGKSIFAMGLGFSGGGGGDCTLPGTYYFTFTNAVHTGGFYESFLYFEVYYDGVNATPVNPDFDGFTSYPIAYNSQYNTRFTDIDFTSSTSSVDFDASYYIDPSEATTTQAERNPTMIRVGYQRTQPTTGPLAYEFYDIASATPPTYGNGTTTFAFANLDANSTYTFTLNFANQQTFFTGIIPFPLTNVYFDVETDSNGAVATTSSIDIMDAVQEQAREYQPCGITAIGGCITNAFIYVFMPSDNALEQFASLRTDMDSRAPFVYATQIPDLWDSLYTTASSASLTVSASTSIGQITFISKSQLEAIPLSSMIRDIIGGLLWVLLGFTLYHRLLRLFDHNEKTAT